MNRYDLDIVASHKELHQKIFGVLLIATLLSQIFHAVSEAIDEKFQSSYAKFLEDFMLLAGRIVDFKQSRFRKICPTLKKGSDAFKQITQPDDQISYICDQFLVWLRNSFGLSKEQLAITVIQSRDGGSRCYYAFKFPDGWQRTKAKDIMGSKTAAARAVESGEPVFIADKLKAEKIDRYVSSDRDRERGNGSIYCYPIEVKTPGGSERFVISVTSYGKLLCAPSDQESADIAQAILREMCRRIELELTLRVMRQWKFGE